MLATTGTGVRVEVSVGVDVSVGRGVGVSVSVGMGVKVSVRVMLVDVVAGAGEGEAGCPPLLKVQANVVNIQGMRRYEILFFMIRFYTNLVRESSPLSSSAQPEGGRLSRTDRIVARPFIFCNYFLSRYFTTTCFMWASTPVKPLMRWCVMASSSFMGM